MFALFLLVQVIFPSNAVTLLDDFEVGVFSMEYLGHSIYGKPNNESSARVNSWKPGDRDYPEYLGTYAEGDILFPRKLERTGIMSESRRWYRGVVPYEISANFWLYERFLVWRAMAAYHRETCIRFVERTNDDQDYVQFFGLEHGCYSSVGRVGGEQKVNLQTPNCLRSGTIIHELMHVVGFIHEHSRYDRDKYIKILYENVLPGMVLQFMKSSKMDFVNFNESYDYTSIMHYSPYAFTKNNRLTIVPTDGVSKIGNAGYFSDKDIRKINKMYKCS